MRAVVVAMVLVSALLGSDSPLANEIAALQPGDQPLRFAVVGDSGTGDEVQYSIARRMCRWRDKHPYDLVVTTGDNVYPNGEPHRFDDAFFEPFSCLLDAGVRFRASLGNHDVQTEGGQRQIDEPAFGMRGHNYVVRVGGVRFVIADSNPLKRKALRKRLPPEPGDVWTVVVFHAPVYSPGAHGSTPGYRRWVPRLLERHGVDLVLNGHDHVYALSKPLKGIRYVVTGGGGAPLYACTEKSFSARCDSRHHFLSVFVSEELITVRAVPIKGPPFQKFTTDGR